MMLLLRLPRRAAATACAAASELALQPPAPAPQLRSAQVASGGQQLQLQWADGRRSSLHTLWLRHNCPCSHCLQPHSGQKRLRPAQLAHAGPLAAAQLDAASQTLRLQWRGDGHTAWLPLRLLQSQLPPPRGCPQLDTRTGGSQGSCAHTVGRLAPTPHEYGALVESEAALYGWLRDMALHGAALVKNAPLHPAVCRHLANRISQPMVLLPWLSLFYVSPLSCLSLFLSPSSSYSLFAPSNRFCVLPLPPSFCPICLTSLFVALTLSGCQSSPFVIICAAHHLRHGL